MSGGNPRKRRPSARISLARASRLYRLVVALAEAPRARERLLTDLGIGLRTFYRELALLRRCGVRIRLTKKLYALVTTAADAAGRLPFPDPQLSFAEMIELAKCDSPAGKRLAEMLALVIAPPEAPRREKNAEVREIIAAERGKKPATIRDGRSSSMPLFRDLILQAD